MEKSVILDKIKEHLNIKSDADLARFFEVKPTVIANWRKRNTFNIELISTKCEDLNLEWLIHGKGEMLRITKNVDKCIKSNFNSIPFYDIGASAGVEFFFNDLPETPEDYISVPFDCEKCIAIPIYGESMEPEYHSGDILLIRSITNFSIIEWGKPHIIITDEQRLFKILRKSCKDSHVILKSLNLNFDDIELEKEYVRKIFKVEGLISKKCI